MSSTVTLTEALRAARDTRCLEIGEGMLGATPRIFRDYFGRLAAMVVADTNTFAAAGQVVHEILSAAGVPVLVPFLFRASGLFAEEHFVSSLENCLRQHTAIPLAVGSGTINDITKLAAHRTGRQYLCVPTAASMDGYTAFGASITQQGSKQTVPCPAPLAVIADLGVISAAPATMSAWGYADLLAKVTAGADWLLADALGEEPIHAQAWCIVQGRLREATADPEGIPAGDKSAIGRLMEGLLLGGFAMQAAQSSRPASGAEHQFSHLWDMEHHTHEGAAPAHGLKVGIGTLVMTALYECLLERPFEKLDVNGCVNAWADREAWMRRARECCGEGDAGTVAVREISAKYLTPERLRGQLELLHGAWPRLSATLRGQLLPVAMVREKLVKAGAATEPEQIGISRARLKRSYWQAFFMRRRFTALDVAVRAGVLDDCLNRIFGPGGLWPLPGGAPKSTSASR